MGISGASSVRHHVLDRLAVLPIVWIPTLALRIGCIRIFYKENLAGSHIQDLIIEAQRRARGGPPSRPEAKQMPRRTPSVSYDYIANFGCEKFLTHIISAACFLRRREIAADV
jgi:hypothetical protein